MNVREQFEDIRPLSGLKDLLLKFHVGINVWTRYLFCHT